MFFAIKKKNNKEKKKKNQQRYFGIFIFVPYVAPILHLLAHQWETRHWKVGSMRYRLLMNTENRLWHQFTSS